MQHAKELMDEIYREKIERARQCEQERINQARRMHPVDKALAGADLFDTCREQMAWGTLLDEPNATPQRLEQVIRQNIKIQREQSGAA